MTAGRVSMRMLPGLLILALGVALLLHNLDVFDLGGLRVFWPLAIIAFGLHVFYDGKSRVVGAALALVGVGLQLETLGWLDVQWGRLRDFWPVLLIAIGAWMLLKRARENMVGGIVLIALGAYFLGRNFNLFFVDLWDLWPVAVIAAGIAMLLRSRR